MFNCIMYRDKELDVSYQTLARQSLNKVFTGNKYRWERVLFPVCIIVVSFFPLMILVTNNHVTLQKNIPETLHYSVARGCCICFV